MLILGLDNRKDAAKITVRPLPKWHLTTSDFEAHLQRCALSARPGLPGYKLSEGKRRLGAGGRTGAGTWGRTPTQGLSSGSVITKGVGGLGKGQLENKRK